MPQAVGVTGALAFLLGCWYLGYGAGAYWVGYLVLFGYVFFHNGKDKK